MDLSQSGVQVSLCMKYANEFDAVRTNEVEKIVVSKTTN